MADNKKEGGATNSKNFQAQTSFVLTDDELHEPVTKRATNTQTPTTDQEWNDALAPQEAATEQNTDVEKPKEESVEETSPEPTAQEEKGEEEQTEYSEEHSDEMSEDILEDAEEEEEEEGLKSILRKHTNFNDPDDDRKLIFEEIQSEPSLIISDDLQFSDTQLHLAADTSQSLGMQPSLSRTGSLQEAVALPIEKKSESDKRFGSSDIEFSERDEKGGYISEAMEYDMKQLSVLRLLKKKKRKHNRHLAKEDDSEESLHKTLKYSEKLELDGAIEAETIVDGENKHTLGAKSVDEILLTTSSSLQFDTAESSLHLKKSTLDYRGLQTGNAFIYMVIPPDGGYGWLILAISFLVQVVVDGIILSIGILLPRIAADFGVSNAEVILVASVQIGCYFLAGTISSAFINNYGFRPVALTGIAISIVAILIATFCRNFGTMLIFYSIIGGPGLSMVWVSSQLIIGFYFEKYRPIANGLSCSGAGAGLLFFMFFNSQVVDKIGWRNTSRCHLIFLCLVFLMGFAYVEVKPSPVGVVHEEKEVLESSSDELIGDFNVFHYMKTSPSQRSVQVAKYTLEEPKKPNIIRRSLRKLSPCCRGGIDNLIGDDYSKHRKRYVIKHDPLQRKDIFYTGPVDYGKDADRNKRNSQIMPGREIDFMASDKQLKSVNYVLTNVHEEQYESRTHKTLEEIKKLRKRFALLHYLSPLNWINPKILAALWLLFDTSLLHLFEFRILIAAAFFFPMGFNIPFVYSKRRAEIPEQYAMLIGPCIGLTNFFARIICGFVAYKFKPLTSYICGGGMVFGGIFVLISAFFGQNLIWFQFLFGLCYGIAPAVYSTLRAIIYVKYLGLSKLTNAFGFSALAMGLGVFIGTTCGGILLETTGGYTAPFAFAGTCIILAGTLKLLLPIFMDYRTQRRIAAAPLKNQRISGSFRTPQQMSGNSRRN